ncbi:SDR family oxidoreductase [Hydrogenophaga aromaticivorans]|mgnify:FL=1|jgi:NAD(P)-dependent dehydrogenase (short-subunit alcohol dehydrogenase family)|uniref:SDR family NAD(P)-dependent oxidoreductase n=1 Tax=Hydrogenophaga TaxID=47420 RepID=UPI001B36B41E|nr:MULTISPECIES: SDR family oxidoreductase [Hydrogenophaga]MBQ0918831.1 SDR family oxidoreductase [Hydrogenophaga aromaticivorans]MDO9481661.1 SDR family oxidoreductase [Hydrogenophaga sp.]MDP3345550.1 SDR family oxidoreductase [Hydrogenophaga sp.]MDP3926690.1 SDR family oxidoreductase [Hydrogenophaga sp.]
MSEKPKTIIITGGASGIGYAFAEHLAQAGHRIVIADLRGAEEAAGRLKTAGHQVLGVQADVVSEADVAHMAEAATAEFGGIDGLVNNAGLFTTLALKPFEQITNQEWMRVMEVNTLGPFNCAKAVLPALRKSGRGRLVNIASTVPIKGPPNMAHYVASKGAVIAFTRSLARELAKDHITVNAIAPGFTLSEGVLQADMQSRIGDNARTAGRCIQRDQVPGDLVAALAYLVSDGAGFVTGQTLAVDGGGVFL